MKKGCILNILQHPSAEIDPPKTNQKFQSNSLHPHQNPSPQRMEIISVLPCPYPKNMEDHLKGSKLRRDWRVPRGGSNAGEERSRTMPGSPWLKSTLPLINILCIQELQRQNQHKMHLVLKQKHQISPREDNLQPGKNLKLHQLTGIHRCKSNSTTCSLIGEIYQQTPL